MKKINLPKTLRQPLVIAILTWLTFLSIILTTHPIIAKNSFNNSPIQTNRINTNLINNLPKTASDVVRAKHTLREGFAYGQKLSFFAEGLQPECFAPNVVRAKHSGQKLSFFAEELLTECFAPTSENENILPKPHPLPETLQQWQDSSGDYLSEIESISSVGYLIWSQFPVTVYIQTPTPEQLETFEGKSLQTWVNFVSQAVAEWSVYFPLKIIADPETADITIWRRRPGLRLSETGEILPARSAEANYQLYHISQQKSDNSTEELPKILAHKFTILLSPTQTGSYIQSAAKHELGHALGIWGHSPLETDVMYLAQVRNSPPISPRDINTLKRIYQQPTYLGWPELF